MLTMTTDGPKMLELKDEGGMVKARVPSDQNLVVKDAEGEVVFETPRVGQDAWKFVPVPSKGDIELVSTEDSKTVRLMARAETKEAAIEPAEDEKPSKKSSKSK